MEGPTVIIGKKSLLALVMCVAASTLIVAQDGPAGRGVGGAGEVAVMSPGVIANSGLREVAAEFTKKTGVTVRIVPKGMGQILNDFKTTMPAADR